MLKSRKKLFVSLLLVMAMLTSLVPTVSLADSQSMVTVFRLSDNFESGSTSNWTVQSGTWGIYTDEGNKVYRQSSLSGTARSIAGEASWTDYSFSADVNIEAMGGYTTNSVHLMARFMDSNNYYDLTYTSSDQTLALRKKVAGTWIVLQSISNAIINDTEYNLKIKVDGSTITGFVNGDQKLSVTDTSFSNGKVGFSTYNQSAKFDNAVVNPSITLYEAEEAVISGASVRSTNRNYTGTGYVDFNNKSGDYIQWTINAPMAGSYLLEFRYSNASGADRPLELKVNNTLVTSALSFPVTPSWVIWRKISISVNLNAGSNTIKLTTIGSEGANIDNLTLYQATEDVRATTVTIEYSTDWGAATQLASGFLHGIGSVYPAQKLINSIAVRAVRGFPHHEMLPSLFDLATYNRVNATGAKIMINMYGDYKNHDPNGNSRPGGDYVAWENYVQSHLDEATQNNYNVFSWIPWNEPNLQWRDNMDGYRETHRRAYNVVKAWNPDARVQAPEWFEYDATAMKDFLTYCMANNCLPDILSWHELSGEPQDIEEHTLDIKNWMLANGITPMPMSITEYQGKGDININQSYDPGLSVNYIARLERSQQNGIIYGLKGNCQWQGDNPDFKAGLDELADSSTLSLPTGRWYLYYWYTRATGRKVKTIQNKDQVEAFATSNSEAKRSIVLLGNPSDTVEYASSLKLSNIPSYLQNEGIVHVRVESVGNTNGGEQHGTTIKLEGNYTVTNNNVFITLPTMGTDTAYIVKVTPGTTYEYQAESLSQTNSGDSYSTFSEAQASGGSAALYAANSVGDWVKYTINVPASGIYNIKALLKKENNRGISQLYVNGVAKGSTVDEYGPFLYFDVDYGNVTFPTAGNQTLEFKVTGKNSLSSSYSLAFDKITLTRQ